MRPLLRLAVRDARAHLRRTILAVLLVALPAFAFIGYLGATLTAPPSAETALATIPPEAQAVLTTTAVRQPAPPFAQLPEGAPGLWIDDTDQRPATAGLLAKHLSAKNRLLPFWNSPDLLAAKGINAKPGEVRTAGEGARDLASVGLRSIAQMKLREAEPEAFAMLAPAPSEGTLPASSSELLITRALADALNLQVGDQLTLVAPPSTGWMSTDGRIGAVIENSQKTYRISGIAPGEDAQAIALAGWISAMVEHDPAGVDGHYLVVGPDPVTWAQAKELNQLQAFAVSRHVLTHYPSSDELYPVAISPAQVLSRLATAIVLGGLGAALVLGLVTPAFAVATEQQRRLLGLASATGATPRDLRRLITTQGLVVGALGGVLGSLVGLGAALAYLAMAHPGADNLRYFPWWSILAALVIATVLGWVTTLVPARWASRQQPIDALRGRTPTAQIRPVRRFVGPALLAVAAVAGIVSLRLPAPALDPAAPPSSYAAPLQSSLLMVLTVGGTVLGLVLSVPLLLVGAARVSRRLPLTARTALQDAYRHQSRTVPAIAAVLVTTMAIAFGLVQTGSTLSEEADRGGTLLTYGGMLLGPHVPVSDDFDRAVLADAVRVLRQRYPVTGSHPVYAYRVGANLVLSAAPAPGKQCPDNSYPDTRSGVEPDAPLRCVPYERAFHPGLTGPWWLGGDVYVMDGAAMRATGRPDADEAARVLDAGGVIVNDATRVANGQVDVVTSRHESTHDTPLRTTRLPGRYVQGFGAPLVVSPKAAQTLGMTNYIYIGEVVELSRPLRPWESSAAARLVQDEAPLAWPGTHPRATPAGGLTTLIMIGILLSIAVLATTISVLLARTQAESDLATMHAVGATRTFLRRYMTSGAGVLLGCGAPLGALAGVVLGFYLVAWNRLLGVNGAFRLTVPLWPLQALSLVLVLLAGLAVAWLASRPPRQLTMRLE